MPESWRICCCHAFVGRKNVRLGRLEEGARSEILGPFPVKGDIVDGNNQFVGQAHVYPKYVEIFNKRRKKVGKVGIMVEKGHARLFLVAENNIPTLVGYASGGKLFNAKDQLVGTFVWTPTYSFVYDANGKRAGKVKCIAWPRVCAAGVGAYLLKVFGDYNAN